MARQYAAYSHNKQIYSSASSGWMMRKLTQNGSEKRHKARNNWMGQGVHWYALLRFFTTLHSLFIPLTFCVFVYLKMLIAYKTQFTFAAFAIPKLHIFVAVCRLPTSFFRLFVSRFFSHFLFSSLRGTLNLLSIKMTLFECKNHSVYFGNFFGRPKVFVQRRKIEFPRATNLFRIQY